MSMPIMPASKPCASLRAARGKGDQGSMVLTEACSRMDCSKQMVTALGEEELCFDHFCARSYELLEHANDTIESPHEAPACGEVLCRLEECARRALEIALRPIELNNLERARLLDILLWSGDLTSGLRQKQNQREKTVGKDGGHQLQGVTQADSRRVN